MTEITVTAARLPHWTPALVTYNAAPTATGAAPGTDSTTANR